MPHHMLKQKYNNTRKSPKNKNKKDPGEGVSRGVTPSLKLGEGLKKKKELIDKTGLHQAASLNSRCDTTTAPKERSERE